MENKSLFKQLILSISSLLFTFGIAHAESADSINCADCKVLSNVYQAPINTDQFIPTYQNTAKETRKPKTPPENTSCADQWKFFKSTYTDKNPIQSMLKAFDGDKVFEEEIKRVMRGDFTPIAKYSKEFAALLQEGQRLGKEVNEAFLAKDNEQAKKLSTLWKKNNDQILELIYNDDPNFKMAKKRYKDRDNDFMIKRSELIDQNIKKVIQENRAYNQKQPAGKKRLLIIKTGQFHANSYFLNHRDQRTMYATRHNLSTIFDHFTEDYVELLPFDIEYKKLKIKKLEKELEAYSKLPKTDYNDERINEIKKNIAINKYNLNLAKKDLLSTTSRIDSKKYSLLINLAAQYQLHGGIDKALEAQIFNPDPVQARDEILIGEFHFERDIEMDKSIPHECLDELGYESVMYAYEGNDKSESGLHDFDYASPYYNRLKRYPPELTDIVCKVQGHEDLCATLKSTIHIVRDPSQEYLVEKFSPPSRKTLFFGLE